jgi:hypothetical protein
MIFLMFAAWAASGVIGYFIAKSKNRDPQTGCLWGVFLGPIGWLVVALSEDRAPSKSDDGRQLKKCPWCAEMVLAEAVVCKHCGKNLSDASEDQLAKLIEKLETKKRT